MFKEIIEKVKPLCNKDDWNEDPIVILTTLKGFDIWINETAPHGESASPGDYSAIAHSRFVMDDYHFYFKIIFVADRYFEKDTDYELFQRYNY